MSRTVTVLLKYHRHKPIDRINLLGSQRKRSMFAVRYEHNPSCVLNIRQDDV
jgi:hypothetical protein